MLSLSWQERIRELRRTETSLQDDLAAVTTRFEEVDRLRREEQAAFSDKHAAMSREKDELWAEVTVGRMRSRRVCYPSGVIVYVGMCSS